MAITIKGSQIRNGAIAPAKADLTATWDFSSGTIQAGTPSNDADVATKSYVDGVAAGLYWKEPVRVGTTGNITLSGTQTIDGIALSAGDRVLVLKQTNQTENGIYVVAAGAWSRSGDMDAGSEFPSAAVFVSEGTVNADTGFVCTNDGAPSLGSDNITFVQFTGTGSITAGAGITKAGSTLSVDATALGGLTFSASGDTGTLEVAIDSAGAIEVAGGELRVKRANNSGLASDSNGLAIALDGDAGLELGAGGIKVKVANSNPGLDLDGNGLAVKLKANSGIGVDGDGLRVLVKNGIEIDGADGSLNLRIDGGSLSESTNGVKVADDGIGIAQQGYRYRSEGLTGTTTHFDLANFVDGKNALAVRAYLNGQRIQQVQSNPADEFQYVVSNAGSTTSIDLGAALASDDVLLVDYVSD